MLIMIRIPSVLRKGGSPQCGTRPGTVLAEHKPSSWAVLLLSPEQLLAAPPGVFAFLSSSLHAACHSEEVHSY